MKSMTAKLLPAVALVLASPWAWGAPGDPTTGIPSTPHDFSGEPTGTVAAGTCTFCHTPHQASSQALLWNQQPPGALPTSYTWVGSTVTTGGTGFATITASGAGANNGPTVKCLSCHDGTAGIGDIGWFDGADRATSLTVAAPNITNTVAPADMTGNHPTSMPMPWDGNGASTYNGQTNGASAVASDWVLDPQLTGIRLFSDTGGGTGISAGAAAGTTGIECSSCHDPHNGATATGPYFLRGLIGGNTTEYICAKCHNR